MCMLVYVHLTFETVPQLEWTDMSNKLEASNGTSEPWEVILNSWGYLASLKMFVFRQFSSEKHPSVISPYFSSQKCHKYNFRICLNSELGFFFGLRDFEDFLRQDRSLLWLCAQHVLTKASLCGAPCCKSSWIHGTGQFRRFPTGKVTCAMKVE